MASELPQMLLEEILCRVPATSLKRLRSTCKEWNRLINDKKFSRMQLDKATKQLPVFMLQKRFKVCLLSVNLHSEIPTVEVTGEVSLIEHSTTSIKYKIEQVFHCDGLLLCTTRQDSRIVIWNPCTGQTRWIRIPKNCCPHFALGYSQASKSYKILSYQGWDRYNDDQGFAIYDISSSSWKKLHVTPIPNYDLTRCCYATSLKGKTYWFAFDKKEEQTGLLSFDYTRERFERLLCLPYQCDPYEDLFLYLSPVKNEKLLVLLRRQNTSREEIWISNKIDDDEAEEMSWNKILDSGYHHWPRSFLVHEEKKILVSCHRSTFNGRRAIVSVVWEDDKTTQVKTTLTPSYEPFFVDYVPSLIQFGL
ncbi:putative F-box protein [Cardamine amara subsp. amara]|uniref:F-box protein n=1 Tax=Cardamine amara subsp. amara TaxID=228776 RepID=A0ABD1BX90_CARAN